MARHTLKANIAIRCNAEALRDGTAAVGEYLRRLGALLDNGTVRDAFGAAGFDVHDAHVERIRVEPAQPTDDDTDSDDDRLTARDIEEFSGYLRNCTDEQVLGVLDKERSAERSAYAALAEAEATRRGLDFERSE